MKQVKSQIHGAAIAVPPAACKTEFSIIKTYGQVYCYSSLVIAALTSGSCTGLNCAHSLKLTIQRVFMAPLFRVTLLGILFVASSPRLV
jgi:hypothetical protein